MNSLQLSVAWGPHSRELLLCNFYMRLLQTVAKFKAKGENHMDVPDPFLTGLNLCEHCRNLSLFIRAPCTSKVLVLTFKQTDRSDPSCRKSYSPAPNCAPLKECKSERPEDRVWELRMQLYQWEGSGIDSPDKSGYNQLQKSLTSKSVSFP